MEAVQWKLPKSRDESSSPAGAEWRQAQRLDSLTRRSAMPHSRPRSSRSGGVSDRKGTMKTPVAAMTALIAGLLLLQPALAPGGGKGNEGRKRPPFPLDKNWADESDAATRPSWKKLPHEDKAEPGAELMFPALKPGESFNLYMPVGEGAWPKNAHSAWFQVRADKPATIL